MNYPLISEYIETIKSSEENFNQLKNLRPMFDDMGNPVMTSGNFAIVFKMEDPTTRKQYAVKCFIKEQEGRAEAYKLIEEELAAIESDYLTSFRYLDKELFVDTTQDRETEYPVLVMDWVEGVTLDKFIRDNLDDQYILTILAYRFSLLSEWLLSQPFAHGDLKPDNIIVCPGCWLKLVDYDGMYVPAMKGQKAREIGSPDFRHPARTEDSFNELIDGFPIISILLSLKAISSDSGLYERFCVKDRLLLSSNDYLDIHNSVLLNSIYPSQDDDLNRLVALLHLALAQTSLRGVSTDLIKLHEPLYDWDYPKVWIDEFGVTYSFDGLRLIKGEKGITVYCCKKGIRIIDAFSGPEGPQMLSSIIIPESVTSIGNDAFAWCSELSSIAIPESVTHIGDRAFQGCSKITSVSFPESVTSIGNGAFALCSELSSIAIPKTVTHIGRNPFAGCKNLKTITVDVNNTHFDSRNESNAIIHTDTNTLISGCYSTVIPNTISTIADKAFKSCKRLTFIELPKSVKRIGKEAFAYCSGLSSIIIPESVISIGNYAFISCTGISSIRIPISVENIGYLAFTRCAKLSSITVMAGNQHYDSRNDCNAIIDTKNNKLLVGCAQTVIPNSVTCIGVEAFSGCAELKEIIIPESVSRIESSAFSDCIGLSSIIVPKTVNQIEHHTFCGCANLNSISIPESITHIGCLAFKECSSLNSIAIPKSVTFIEKGAFDDCCGLQSITVDPDNSQYDSREQCNAIIESSTNELLVGCQKTIIPNTVSRIGYHAFRKCPILSLTIPESVKSIGYCAFYECTNLLSIGLPDSISKIENGAFYGCTSFTSIIIPASLEIIGPTAFKGCNNLRSIIYPKGLKRLISIIQPYLPNTRFIKYDPLFS